MQLAHDQASGLRNLLHRNSLRVALFVSGVRSTGKSTVIANLALAGAQHGRNMLLIDEARHGVSAVADCLGIRARYDLLNVLAGDCDVDDVILRGPEGVSVLPLGRFAVGGEETRRDALAIVNSEFERVADETDWLLIDATSGFDTRLLPLALSANEVVIVTPADRNGLTGSYAMMKLLHQEFGISRFQALVSRTRDRYVTDQMFGRLRGVARRHLGARLDLLGSIPYDADVKRAAASVRPLISAYPNADSSRAIRACAERLLGSSSRQMHSDPVALLFKRLVEGGRIDFAAVAA